LVNIKHNCFLLDLVAISVALAPPENKICWSILKLNIMKKHQTKSG